MTSALHERKSEFGHLHGSKSEFRLCAFQHWGEENATFHGQKETSPQKRKTVRIRAYFCPQNVHFCVQFPHIIPILWKTTLSDSDSNPCYNDLNPCSNDVDPCKDDLAPCKTRFFLTPLFPILATFIPFLQKLFHHYHSILHFYSLVHFLHFFPNDI